MKDKKTLKKGKNSAAMKISDIWIGLDGVEKVEVGELLGENTSVTTFSIRHRCHTHHLLSHSAQQILEFLHRQILKINKTQNSKIRILLCMVYYTYLNSDCWSFVGLIIVHKNYTTMNQSKILDTL